MGSIPSSGTNEINYLRGLAGRAGGRRIGRLSLFCPCELADGVAPIIIGHDVVTVELVPRQQHRSLLGHARAHQIADRTAAHVVRDAPGHPGGSTRHLPCLGERADWFAVPVKHIPDDLPALPLQGGVFGPRVQPLGLSVMLFAVAVLMVASASAQVPPATDLPADFSFRLSARTWAGCTVTDTIDSTTQTYTRHFSIVYNPEDPHKVAAAVPVSEDLKRTLHQWVQENRFFSYPAYFDPRGNREKFMLHREFASYYELQITASGATHTVHWLPDVITSDPARRLYAVIHDILGRFRQMSAVTALRPLRCQ